MVFADEIIPWALGIFCSYAPVHGVFIVWKMVIQQNSLKRLQNGFIMHSGAVEICQYVEIYLVAIPKIQMYQSDTFAYAMLQGLFFHLLVMKFFKSINILIKTVMIYAYSFQCKLKNVALSCSFSFKTTPKLSFSDKLAKGIRRKMTTDDWVYLQRQSSFKKKLLLRW